MKFWVSQRPLQGSLVAPTPRVLLPQHFTHVKTRTGKQPKRIHMDGGTDFIKSKDWVQE